MPDYKPAPGGYPDRAVTEAACPQCGAPAGYLCAGQHGLIIHAARAQAWKLVSCCVCGARFTPDDPAIEYRSLDMRWWCADDAACLDRACRLAAVQSELNRARRELILAEMEIALANVWEQMEQEGWQWPG